jgi:hypothetical protein
MTELNVLISLNQNGTAIKKTGSKFLFSRITRLPAERKNLTHSVYVVERGNPVWSPVCRESTSQDLPMAVREQEVRRSECLAVMVRILIEI